MTTYKTRYYGINVCHDAEGFWFQTDDGIEEWFGLTRPTLADIDEFRDSLENL